MNEATTGRRAAVVGAIALGSMMLASAVVADTINGTPGADRIVGTPRADRINTGTGNDVVRSLAGSDDVRTGRGADRIQLGRGADAAFGGLGDDQLFGGRGDDALSGAGFLDYSSADRDVAYGGRGHDDLFAHKMFGGVGRDSLLILGSGRHLAVAGPGNDKVITDEDEEPGVRDEIRCGDGFDTVEYWTEVDPADRVVGCERLLFSHRGD